MSENILEKIVNKKRNKIQILKKDISINSLNDKITNLKNYVNFKEKIINNINIGENVIVGAGSLVLKNIPDNVKAFGSPTNIIKEI